MILENTFDLLQDIIANEQSHKLIPALKSIDDYLCDATYRDKTFIDDAPDEKVDRDDHWNGIK